MTVNAAQLTEFRDRVSEILDEIEATGEEWVITRHGRNVAVVLAFEEYESLIETINILSDDETMAAIDEGLEDLREDRVEEL